MSFPDGSEFLRCLARFRYDTYTTVCVLNLGHDGAHKFNRRRDVAPSWVANPADPVDGGYLVDPDSLAIPRTLPGGCVKANPAVYPEHYASAHGKHRTGWLEKPWHPGCTFGVGGTVEVL